MLISTFSLQNICSMINHFDQTRSVLKEVRSGDESDVLELMFIVLKEEVTTNFPLAHKQASKTNWDIQTIIVVGCKKVVKRPVFVRILGWWWWQKTFRPVTGYLGSVSRIVTIIIRCQTKSLGGWQKQFFMAHVHKFLLLCRMNSRKT